MKKILLVALAAITLASCAKNEVVELNEGNAISFRAWTANAGRAEVMTTGEIAEFKTWGYVQGNANAYFNGVEVTKTGSTWDYAPHKFWPAESVLIDFYSVSPMATNCAMTLDSHTIPAYAVNADVASQIDLLYAVNIGEHRQDPVKAVQVKFDHALSQIHFAAKSTNPQLQVDIKAVSIANINSVGTFTFPTTSTTIDIAANAAQGNWTALGTKVTYNTGMNAADPIEVPLTGSPVVLTDATAGRPLLIPQKVAEWAPATDAENTAKGAYFIVKCSVQDVSSQVYLWGDASTYVDVAIPFTADWQPGMSYLYTFVFGEGAGYEVPEVGDAAATPVLFPITFEVEVDDFKNAADQDSSATPAL